MQCCLSTIFFIVISTSTEWSYTKHNVRNIYHKKLPLFSLCTDSSLKSVAILSVFHSFVCVFLTNLEMDMSQCLFGGIMRNLIFEMFIIRKQPASILAYALKNAAILFSIFFSFWEREIEGCFILVWIDVHKTYYEMSVAKPSIHKNNWEHNCAV